MNKDFKPGTDLVVIEYLENSNETPSGIIVETIEKTKYPAQGKILSVGKGVEDVKVGDIVLYDSSIHEELELENGKVDVVLHHNILGTFI